MYLVAPRKSSVEALSDLVEVHKRLFIQDVYGTQAQLQTPSDLRNVYLTTIKQQTGLIVSHKLHNHLGLALMADRLSINLDNTNGSWVSWHVSNLIGQEGSHVSEHLYNNTSALETNNFIYYLYCGTLSLLRNAKTADGSWIDLVVGINWFNTRIVEDTVNSKQSVIDSGGVIPFNQAGAVFLDNIARRRVAIAINNGLIVDGSETIDLPNPAEATVTQRSSRRFPDVFINATFQGEIDTIEYRGTISQ